MELHVHMIWNVSANSETTQREKQKLIQVYQKYGFLKQRICAINNIINNIRDMPSGACQQTEQLKDDNVVWAAAVPRCTQCLRDSTVGYDAEHRMNQVDLHTDGYAVLTQATNCSSTANDTLKSNWNKTF